MQADKFAEIKAVFAEVCELAEPELTERLHELTSDADVSAEVRALMGAQSMHTDRFAQPIRQLLSAVASEDLKIGHGGMGTVFRAHRSDGHFQQLAAIKLLRGMPSLRAIDYLAQERQILATLAHPNISRLLDGGATPHGQPYLVMEYVQGEPIDVYCRDRRISATEILRLFVVVCHAVSFAHQRLIVHCDLKPNNILVTADGRPLLLDFGIARLLESGNTPPPDPVQEPGDAPNSSTTQLKLTGYAYTPRYASPEQRAGNAVSTATDIYSLGLMLVELLTLNTAAANQSLETQSIADPELRAIATKASATDPSQRYATADAFASDIERFLRREPVLALQPSAWYGMRKFVQRRWPLVVMAVLFVLTVAGFTLRVVADRNRAELAEQDALVERDHALQAQTSSRQISDFMVSVFDGSNPDAGGGEIPTSKLVEQALGRIDTELKGQPAAQAELFSTLAGVQVVLGNAEPARTNFTRAIDIQRTLDQPLVLANMLMRRADTSKRSFGKEAPEADAREALALIEKYAAPDSAILAKALDLLGTVLSESGKHADDEALLLRALAIQQHIDPIGSGTAEMYASLGSRYVATEEYEKAVTQYQRGLELQAILNGKNSATYFSELESLGMTYSYMRRFDEAETLLRQALDGRRKLDGSDNVEMAWRMSQLARVIDNSGRPRQAAPVYREALTIGAKKMGVTSVSYAVLLINLAISSRRSGDFASAEQAYAQALPIIDHAWPASNRSLQRVRNEYGTLLLREGKIDAARTPLFTAYEARLAALGAEHADVSQSLTNLAEWELKSSHLDKAMQRLASVEPHAEKLDALDHAAYERVLGLTQAKRGHNDDALLHLQRAEKLIHDILGERDPRTWLSMLDRAELLAAQNNLQSHAASAALATEMLRGIGDGLMPDSALLAHIKQLANR
ncbi:serine/threonine-protein kinase [Pseudolysobacter antarcticus]|nr:serine/threonine-protein kinase [Pseudolysobacter antarcticus]